MAVKRHAICGTINSKARHIYDVVRLFKMQEIQGFLADKPNLKRLMVLTKQTDAIYLEKRNIPEGYGPTGSFDFASWKTAFMEAKGTYEHLHVDLLYTDKKQIFDDAVSVFEQINELLMQIDE
jgi:hypothetical protein